MKQTGSICKRGGRFIVRYWALGMDGSKKRMTKSMPEGATKTEADQWLRNQLVKVDEGRRFAVPTTLGEWAADGFDKWANLNLKPSTASSYRSQLKTHILPIFGQSKLADITPGKVQPFLVAKGKGGLSSKSVRHLYGALMTLLNQARKAGLIDRNPLADMDPPRFTTQEKPILTRDQVVSVIQAAPPRHQPLFQWLWESGLRAGEALAIKWEDLDMLGSRITIRRSIWKGKVQTTKTKNSVRLKFVSASMLAAFKDHRATSAYTEPTDYVFTNDAGHAWDQSDLRHRVLYPALAKAGIERKARCHGFHLFRHSAVSDVLNGTKDLKMASTFAGHSSVGITAALYAHLLPDAEREAIEKHALQIGLESSGERTAIQ